MRLIMFFLILALSNILVAETISLNTADTAPYSTNDNNGFYDTLLKEVFNENGYSIKINHYPSVRSIGWANDGHDDGEFARISGISTSYSNLIEVKEPLISFNFVAIMRQGNKHVINSWEDLKGLRIGFLNGWKIYEDNIGSYQNVTKYNDFESMVKVLLSNRLDVILYSKLSAKAFIEDNNINGITVMSPPLSVRTMHLYMHYSHSDKVNIIDDTLKRFKETGRYDQIYKLYFFNP